MRLCWGEVVTRYLLGFFVAGLMGLPSAGWAMDVVNIYQKALQNDSEYREAVQSYLSKRESRYQGIAGLLPKVELVGSIDRVSQEKKVDAQAGVASVDLVQHQYDVRLAQPLFDAEKLALYNKGKREAMQAELELESARQDLRLRVVEAFFGLLYADDTLNAYQAQKDATFEFMDQARKSFAIGTVTASDVYDAQARFETVSAKVMQAEIDLELKRKALWVLAGEPIEHVFPLRKSLSIRRPEPADLQPWLDQAGTSNLDVQIQDFALGIAAADVDYSRAGHYPTLELTARLNLNDQSASMSSFEDSGPGQRTEDSYVGLQATLPLFEGGYVMSKVRQAEYANAAASEKLDRVRKESVETARESFVNTTVGARKIEILRAAVSASQDALRASKLGYGVGVRTAVDVLNAQEQLSLAMRDLSKSTYDALIYSLKLQAAVGALRDEDLMQIRGYTEYSR